ncbi:hypothetical protein AWB69_00853 [Caballeronia udeis]|uniref:Uncharacterized protein n=1 Tax=Caballeronia udeis TaxID=1232866 RepID=A0A158F9H5_9BURK|nr:hypothetical protein [Caballeronia udeis]SAL16381.1 hypothetical protein AWB69_00853 [Caballeronia udeis]
MSANYEIRGALPLRSSFKHAHARHSPKASKTRLTSILQLTT